MPDKRNTQLARVYLDRSGYEYGTGYYYGSGKAIYSWIYDDGVILKEGTLRAFDRDDAKAQVRFHLKTYGLVPRFWR